MVCIYKAAAITVYCFICAVLILNYAFLVHHFELNFLRCTEMSGLRLAINMLLRIRVLYSVIQLFTKYFHVVWVFVY